MRIFEPKMGSYAFNLEECEERWLISAYEEIKDRIPAGQAWPAEFENHYYQVGYGVRECFIALINSERKRISLEELTLKETWVGDYSRTNDKAYKAGRRRGWRDEYRHLSVQ